MNLHLLLQDIADGQLVDFQQVVRQLPANSEWKKTFKAEHVGENKFYVSIKNYPQFMALLEHASSSEPSFAESANLQEFNGYPNNAQDEEYEMQAEFDTTPVMANPQTSDEQDFYSEHVPAVNGKPKDEMLEQTHINGEFSPQQMQESEYVYQTEPEVEPEPEVDQEPELETQPEPEPEAPRELDDEKEIFDIHSEIVKVARQTHQTPITNSTPAPVMPIQEVVRHTKIKQHVANGDSAYMLCFPAQPASRSLNTVAVVDNEFVSLPFTPAKHAILIENQDCFFRWELFLDAFASSIELAKSDIYFSAGKGIPSDAFLPLLRQYQSIDCAFNYDLKGLKTAEHVFRKMTQPLPSHSTQNHLHIKISYLLPDGLSQLGSFFTCKPNSPEEFKQMLALCDNWQLDTLKELMIKTSAFMPQAALLPRKTSKN